MDVGDSTGVDESSLPKDKDGKPIRKNQIKTELHKTIMIGSNLLL